jgi:hypothetical protein
VGLARSLGLGAEVGGGTAGGEETANHGLEEGVEDNLGTAVKEVSYWSKLGHGIGSYLVWGRAIHMIRTNLKM